MPLIIYCMTAKYNMQKCTEYLSQILHNLLNIAIYGKNTFLALARPFLDIFASNFGCRQIYSRPTKKYQPDFLYDL